MATYRQWRDHADKGDVKRVTWVCGEERTLVEEVVDTTRQLLSVSEMDYVALVAGLAPDKEVWAAMNQYPMEPTANRLVLVRDAEKLKRWRPFEDWMSNSRQMPTVYLLFVSGQHEFPYIVKDGKSTGEFPPHIDVIKNRGRLVRCSTPNEDDLLAWVQRQAPMDGAVAQHLLERAAGNLGIVSNVCRKAALFPGRPSTTVIDVLCAEAPSDDFVDSLLTLNKQRAIRSLEAVPTSDYGKVIGRLDSRLELLAKLHSAVRQRKTLKDIAVSGKSDVPVFLARTLYPVAKHYDPIRRRSCRTVLTATDAAVRSGSTRGVMESLVALW